MNNSITSGFSKTMLAAALLLSAATSQAQHFPFSSGKNQAKAATGISGSQAKVNALISRPGTSQDYMATGQGTWQLQANSTYSYDSQGRLLLRVYADPTSNQQLAKEHVAYDAFGNETLYKVEQWNGTSWDVVSAYKIQTTYNAQGLPTEEIFQDWDQTGNIWVNQARTTTTYDPNNRALEITNADWKNAAWELTDRMVLSHANGTASEALIQEYNGTTWDDLYRIKNLTWQVLYATPSAYTLEYFDSGLWIPAEKYQSVYDVNGGHVGIYQEYDATGNAWINTSRETETYDANRNFTGWKEEAWNAMNSTWDYSGEEKELLTYAGMDITERIFQDSWNSSQTLQDRNKEVYANFQTFQVSGVKPALAELAVNVYPNPATDKIQIALPASITAFTATLSDVTGKIWQTKTFKSAEEKQLNLETLPKGIYLLQLQTETGSTVKRIVKQ